MKSGSARHPPFPRDSGKFLPAREERYCRAPWQLPSGVTHSTSHLGERDTVLFSCRLSPGAAEEAGRRDSGIPKSH